MRWSMIYSVVSIDYIQSMSETISYVICVSLYIYIITTKYSCAWTYTHIHGNTNIPYIFQLIYTYIYITKLSQTQQHTFEHQQGKTSRLLQHLVQMLTPRQRHILRQGLAQLGMHHFTSFSDSWQLKKTHPKYLRLFTFTLI